MAEPHEDGAYLVRVRAQVMMRDDSTGGWVPMGGGGLSNVSVRKRPLASANANANGDINAKHDFLIFGRRISDQSVVLSCIIKKDFEYNKVMPTFHHWKTGEKKFGLTFQTAADARAFDKGLRTAVDELLDGMTDPPPVHSKHAQEIGDDDVFMTLNLPVERGDSRSSSDSSARTSRHATPPHAAHTAPPQPVPSPPSYSYVQLTSDLMYPSSLDDSSGSIKKRSLEVLPKKDVGRGKSGGRTKCQYCQEWFLEEENRRGACEYAPDCVRRTLEEVACVRCARAMLYHCMSDAEGDLPAHPCELEEQGCGRRWLGLALLALLVPCLFLYPPLRACHWCCVRCGVCGGRHRAAS